MKGFECLFKLLSRFRTPETDKFTYVYADYSLTLPQDFVVSVHVGHNSLDEEGGFLAPTSANGDNEDSYIDYSIGVAKEWMGVEFSLAWVDTDLDEEDAFDTDWAEGTAVFSISKSL